MNMSKRLLVGLLSSFLLAPIASAQIPGVGGAAVPGVVGVPAAPAAPANLWSFLCLTPQQKLNAKTCFCNSALGKMVSSATAPMSAMTGGLIQNRCLANSIANDIANMPATSSGGAAARIKKDEEEAKARRQAVRYLGTVDCNYWPEATEALVLSLRKDPNECVRFEAALSLRNGCCCNEKTVKALEMCVSGSDKDGAPAERSDRVRAAAADALARCPLIQKIIEEEKGKDGEIKKTEGIDPREYYRKLAQSQREQVVASARGLLVNLQQANNTAPSAAPANPQRSGNLADIIAHAFGNTHAVSAPVTVTSQAKPLSLYEIVTTRNSSREYIVPAGPTRIIPANPETIVSAPVTRPQTYVPIKTERVVPSRPIGFTPVQMERVTPSQTVPFKTAAPTPLETRPTAVQGSLRSPLPTGPQAPEGVTETRGYVTLEVVPVAPPTPSDIRTGRP